MATEYADFNAAPIIVTVQGRRFYLLTKRLFDLCVSLALILVLSPVFVIIAICVKLDSAGPAIFRQTRAGQDHRSKERRRQRAAESSDPGERRARPDRRATNLGGKPFMFYKFRTMYVDADPEIHRKYMQALIKSHLQDQNDAKQGSEIPYKMNHDPRVTRVGRILRKTSLDELPQLFNVLFGEMSLVGPRPPILYELENYRDWHKVRLKVLPGMTGLWQVQGRGFVPFDEMVRLDLYYIEHMSVWLDFKILLLTPMAVITGKGAT
jgi:lipopolysaccharide/colanic/teichoic acid biosynthesis glycosyltransferase